MVRCGLELAFFAIVAAGLGCLGPQRAEYQSTQAVALADPSEEADRLWEAIQDTLREYRFQLDRVDRREGIITTLPVSSQHFFELWRHDVDTRRDFWEATLNPLRRWAEVAVIRGDDQGSWKELAVVMHKERLSSPDRQFNSSGAAYQYFSDSLPSTTGAPRIATEQDVWLDVGRDSAMEEHLLRKMLLRAGLEGTVQDR